MAFMATPGMSCWLGTAAVQMDKQGAVARLEHKVLLKGSTAYFRPCLHAH